MGLSIKSSNRFGHRIATLIAVFALVAQPMYGLVASQLASAAPNTSYTPTAFTELEPWVDERLAPSDGKEITANTLKIGVDGNKKHPNYHYRFEGLAGNVPAGTTSARASLYIDEDWKSVSGLDVEMWAKVHTTNPETPEMWPAIFVENANDNQVAVQAWSPSTGAMSAPVHFSYNSTISLEIESDPVTGELAYYANGSQIFRHGYTNYRFGAFEQVIFTNVNPGGGDAGSYQTTWSNLNLGRKVLPVPAGLKSETRDGRNITNRVTNVNYVKNSWNQVPGAVSYNYEFDKPGNVATFKTNTKNTYMQGEFHTRNATPTGEYQFRVQAVFADGSKSDFSNWSKVSYDGGNPETDLKVGYVTGKVVGPKFTVSGTATDDRNLSRVYVQLVNRENNQRYGGTTVPMSGTNKEWSYQYDTNALDIPEGTYAAHVEVTDEAGNRGTFGWTENFTLDKTAPSFAITTPANGSTVRANTDIAAEITDSNGITKVLMTVPTKNGNRTLAYETGKTNNSLVKDGNTYRAVDFDTTTMNDGVAHVTLRATDGAGNTRYWNNNANNRQHSFTVDNTAPKVTNFHQVYENHSSGGRIAVTLTFDEALAAGSLTDDWSEVAGSNGRQFVNHYYRTQTETVTYRDAANNQGSYTFTVDMTAPTAELYATPENAFVGDTVRVTGQVEDNDIKSHWFEITLPDGSVYHEYKMNTTEKAMTFELNTAQGAGDYHVRYVATDRVGNRSDNPNYSNPKVMTITVKERPPAEVEPPVEPVDPPVELPTDPKPEPQPPIPQPTPDEPRQDQPDTTESEDTQTPSLLNPGILAMLDAQAAESTTEEEESETEGDVLADEDNTQNDQNGDVLADEDQADDGCFKLLGLCWYWWIPIVLAIALVGYMIRRALAEDDELPTRRQ